LRLVPDIVSGEVYGKCRAEAFAPALDGDGASVALDDLLYDRQADTQPAMHRGVLRGRLPVRLEEMRERFLRYAAPVVRDRDYCLTGYGRSLHRDRAVPGGELYRVREEVPEDLSQAVHVGEDGDRSGLYRKRVRYVLLCRVPFYDSPCGIEDIVQL